MILVLTAVLMAANAVCVLMEFALMRVRPARVEVLARAGSARAAAVQDVLGRLDEHLAAMQVCLAVITISLGAVAEPAVMAVFSAALARRVWALPETWISALSFLLAVSTLAWVQMILAELVPRAVAIHFAEPIALLGARPLKVLAYLLRLPIRATTACSKTILRLFGLKPAAEAEYTVTLEEMRVLLGETHDKGALPLERLLLLENLFDFGSSKASEAMRSREKIVFLSLAKPWSENVETIRKSRFTRYPLCELGLDTIIGYVHLKDIALAPASVEPDLRKLRRDLVEVVESEPLEKLLKVLPSKGVHMVLVRDSAGGISGLLTLEDIVEELIGEVRDEFSRLREKGRGPLFARAVVDANLPPGERSAAIRRLLVLIKNVRPDLDVTAAFDAVWERELKFASAVGHGALVPHARLPGLSEPCIAVGRYAKPAPVPTPDNVPVRLVFLVLTPAETPVLQLKILQRIASLVTNETLRRKLWRAKNDEALLELLRTADTLLAR